MALPKMGNCPKCKKLFLQIREICDDCYQKQETDLVTIKNYLRNHKGCTMLELSEATSVPVAQIRQFILANRILLADFPNMSYNCEICGTLIRNGRTCASCEKTVNKLAGQMEKPKEKEKTKSYLRVTSHKI